MPTLVFDPQPTEFERLLERRRHLDQDRRDEVWDGVLHMIPPPSVEHERIASLLHRLLGPPADNAALAVTGTIGVGRDKDDYRVPDLALLRPGCAPQWNETAALVVEILSPRDQTWNKVPFYAAHHVDGVVVLDPEERRVHWLALRSDGEYRPVERSALLDLGVAELAEALGWPS